jgi:NAD(P) transhydrogenase subunit alpha
VVITTALIPGKPAPRLLPAAMVEAMKPGSVIVDLAAERGGNCELTHPGETYQHNQVTIVGQTDLISTVAHDASAMYANTLAAFLKHLAPKGELTINSSDEITSSTLVCQDGQVVNAKVKEALGIG